MSTYETNHIIFSALFTNPVYDHADSINIPQYLFIWQFRRHWWHLDKSVLRKETRETVDIPRAFLMSP